MLLKSLLYIGIVMCTTFGHSLRSLDRRINTVQTEKKCQDKEKQDTKPSISQKFRNRNEKNLQVQNTNPKKIKDCIQYRNEKGKRTQRFRQSVNSMFFRNSIMLSKPLEFENTLGLVNNQTTIKPNRNRELFYNISFLLLFCILVGILLGIISYVLLSFFEFKYKKENFFLSILFTMALSVKLCFSSLSSYF